MVVVVVVVVSINNNQHLPPPTSLHISGDDTNNNTVIYLPYYISTFLHYRPVRGREECRWQGERENMAWHGKEIK